MFTFKIQRHGPWLVLSSFLLWTACAGAPPVETPNDAASSSAASVDSSWSLVEPSPPLLDGVQSFEDARLETSKALSRIGFGSCLKQYEPQPIFDAILEDDFDLFLFLGDNVYGDVTSPAMTELREAYREQALSEGLRTLRSRTPVRATWDDHDYGDNDVGVEFFGKEASQGFFAEFWNLPTDSPVRHRPGIYDALIAGPPGQRVQVLLLDTRYFRSDILKTPERDAPGMERYVPDEDPDKTLLGDAQWRWLEDQLRQPAEVRILVSSIQVLAEGHGWEAWRLLPKQRQKLYETIAATGAEGVVMLSGDRHRAGIYRHPDAIGYPLYEITSSSMNAPSRHGEEPGPMRLGPTYRPVNYGAVLVDWDAQTVGLEVRGLDGQTALQETIELANLRR